MKKKKKYYVVFASSVHVIHFRITLKIFMDPIIFDMSFEFSISLRFFFPLHSFIYFFFLSSIENGMMQDAHDIGAVSK